MRQLYVIRHKPTGFMLPAGHKGFTFDKPEDPSKVLPRLFNSRRAAANALWYWLAGPAVIDYDEETGRTYAGATFDPNRIEADMEIVPVWLTLEEPK